LPNLDCKIQRGAIKEVLSAKNSSNDWCTIPESTNESLVKAKLQFTHFTFHRCLVRGRGGVQRATALSTLTLGHCHARMGNTSHNVSRILTLYERLQGSRTHSTGSGDGIPF